MLTYRKNGLMSKCQIRADTEIETSVSASPRRRYDEKSHISATLGKMLGGPHRYPHAHLFGLDRSP